MILQGRKCVHLLQNKHGIDLDFNTFVKENLANVMWNPHFSSFRSHIFNMRQPVTLYKTENMNQSLDVIFKEIGYTPYGHYRMNQMNSDTDYQSKYNKESISIIEDLYGWDLEKLGYNLHGSTNDLGILLSDI